MKRFALTILLLTTFGSLSAQLYNPGEVLDYRISYKAKMFPNTEVGSVQISTTEDTSPHNGNRLYKVIGAGRTLPTYRWFFPLEDTYTVWVSPTTLRPLRFQSDLHEGDYTFWSHYAYDWENARVKTRWQSRQNPIKEKTIPLTPESMDPISLFFNLRTVSAEAFRPGVPATLQVVLEDTVRHLNYRFIGRETKKIRNMGKFNTLRFECQLGTTQGFSFTDGSTFTIWFSDDNNKIPLYIESPIKIGSINVYISGYKGLKYPVSSLIK